MNDDFKRFTSYPCLSSLLESRLAIHMRRKHKRIVWAERQKRHRPSEMEYYYSGTESLWSGTWIHLVCRTWNCEIDNPSQSTVVNLDKKDQRCFLLCPWSQVQLDTSGPKIFHILGCLWTMHHRDANCFFPLRAKTEWIPLLINTERYRREEEHNSSHWNDDCLL